ncbi:DUF4243 domain-containing protein [Pelomonas sp. V22]|uniref:questin oxidase family protein n=1 Tax=Pelomonas sp. V22 TaxID=2822139 RepID=UPI0024A8979A|nr:questin oxidase family protein [Pelomonas sp. V22]MDI4633598.1 DUF4243 domain-containing protein [Pelomonas sp. V22]
MTRSLATAPIALGRHAPLQAALDEALQYGANYPSQGLSLSTHLPMVLVALARLEAPAEALQRQLRHWAARLPAAEPMPAGTSQRPLSELLADLLLAPESAAFHGPIRLAYALESGHAGEQAAALTAWIKSRFMLGPPLAAAPGTESLRATLDAVRADPAMALALPAGRSTIVTDMKAAVALQRFEHYLPSPRLSLDELAEASLATYLSTHHFTALHLVTGLHALRVLLARAEARTVDQGQVLRHAWRAWLAAYVAIGRPALAWAAVHAGSASEADWELQLPALHQSLNDHRIKLADASREEWRLRGWPGYALCLQSQGGAR